MSIIPGFLIEVSQNRIRKNFGSCRRDDLIIEKIEDKKGKYYIERRTINKFLNDKIFFENKDFIILTEGVILNRKQLEEKYNKTNFFETIILMYQNLGEDFFKEFRGSFSGFLYDKFKDKWIIYTNHFGDKQVFYYTNNDNFIIGSEVLYITNYLKKNGFSYTFNTNGAYMLLTYGYMLEDNTLIKEIKKLIAGHYIVLEKGTFKIKKYFEIDNEPDYSLKEDEIIEELDNLFKKAVKLEFEKDLEYGYKHIASLSGGLDSRMTVWVANKEGYNDLVVYTFSQSDYLDEKIAKKIASELKNEFIFKSLDNGIYLIKNDMVRRQVEINFGNVLYSGNAHVRSFADLINFKNFGLVHTGQLGDVIVGTYSSKPFHLTNFNFLTGSYSTFLKDKLKNIKLNNIYKNEEKFKMYNRGFNGILQGNLPFQEYTEVVSPFLDIDFFNFCMKIPLKYRYNHKIYFKWILKKYPKAAKYKWEKINAKITTPLLNIFGRKIPLTQIIPKITKKLFYKSSINSKYNMNPFDYWYRKNPELKEYFDMKFYENKKTFDVQKELLEDAERLYNNGNVIEKTQVLTLLEAYKFYFVR